jgi:hypothetical protein
MNSAIELSTPKTTKVIANDGINYIEINEEHAPTWQSPLMSDAEILLLSRQIDKTITGWLTDDEIETIRERRGAKITMNALDDRQLQMLIDNEHRTRDVKVFQARCRELARALARVAEETSTAAQLRTFEIDEQTTWTEEDGWLVEIDSMSLIIPRTL